MASQLVPIDNSSIRGGRGLERTSADTEWVNTAESDGASFGQMVTAVLDLVVRRKWIFASLFAVSIGAVGLYTLLTPREYRASAFVMIDLDGQGPTQSVGLAETENMQFVRRERTIEDEILLLQISDPLAERVADRMVEAIPSPDANGVMFNDEGERLAAGQLAQVIGHYVEFATVQGGSSVIQVEANSSVPTEAALIANFYVFEYVKLTRDVNRAHLSASRSFLEDQEEQWRQKLFDAEESVQAYQGVSTLDQKASFLVAQTSTLEAQRDQLEIDLQLRRASRTSLESELDRINPGLAKRVASSLAQEIELIRSRSAELEVDRKEILLRYPNTDPAEINHPDLQVIDLQLQRLRSDLSELSEQYVSEIQESGGMADAAGVGYAADLRGRIADEKIQIQGLEAQLAMVERRLGSYVDEMLNLPMKSLAAARLERTRQHALQMYESVVRRLQEMLVMEQAEPGYARELRQAAIPALPASPDIPMNLILGVLLGLLIGSIGSVLLDKIDNRIYKPENLQERGIDVIGVVPDWSHLLNGEVRGDGTVDVDGRSVASGLIGLTNPRSAAAEAYRHLRTYIQFSGDDRVVRRILVTSANMGEGKSVTSANLGIMMAQSGRRTIVIDADLRRPRLGKLFGVEHGKGLADVLDGGVAFATVLHDGSVPQLSVMPAGSEVDNPSELLGSRSFRELLEDLDRLYDVVIVDSPPVRVATDAALLSTQCDAAIVVMRAGSTRPSELGSSLRSLRSVGGNVLGVLFNAFDVKMAYGYKYLYSRYDDYATYSTYGHSE